MKNTVYYYDVCYNKFSFAFTMTTMPLFWFYFKASRGWYTVVYSTNYKLIK